MDAIESICAIPNSTDNFDEVWMVVNRENGRFVERMVAGDRTTDCGGELTTRIEEQVRMDSTVDYNEGTTITQIKIIGTLPRVVTSPEHGFSDGDVVYFRDVTAFPELNNTYYSITNATTNAFYLDEKQ